MQSQVGHLDGVHSDLKVLEMIRWGMLILVIRGQESQTPSSRDHQAQVHPDQMVLMMARQEAGPQERKLTQELHSLKLKLRGTTRLKYTQIRWFSW